MNSLFIKEFLDEIRTDLKRMSYRTQGETSSGDLENEAYLLLVEFIEIYGRKPNLWDPKELRWITGRLYNKFVKWPDHKFRYALRIDSLENDEGESWALDLPAEANSDPLKDILFKEEILAHQSLLDKSYSEAKAYVVTFNRFKHEKEVLSNYWFITSQTLDKRFNRAIVVLTHQPSLFDRIEVINESFNAMPGREKAKATIHLESGQSAWGF